ncbi:cupin domain-containing protein [Candidatus Woesearchaeota archaeon]|nr:cupin domain-containing protein [Candidatus Woesearchaeota archaeon]
MEVTVRKPTQEEIEEAAKWSFWEKAPSVFPWIYSVNETCYILDGHAIVTYEGGQAEFGKGDWVIFPKGLSCKWKVTEKIRKQYSFW